MHNIYEEGIGREIRVLPRRSIHSHPGCIFSEQENMARFGVPDQGRDEPDNVQSKLANPITTHRTSPRYENIHRKNSLPEQSCLQSESVLSRSAPAALHFSPLHSSSTDDDEDVAYQSNNTSYNSIGNNRSNTSVASRNNNSPVHTQRFPEWKPTLDNQNSWNCSLPVVGTIAVALLAVISSMFFVPSQIIGKKTSVYDQGRFYNDISLIGEKYNIDEDSILRVQSGISTIVDREDTGSFMFVYNRSAQDFDPVRFNQFIHDISLAAAKYLRNESSSPTVVDGSSLDMAEYGQLMCLYRDVLASSGVLLVRRLHAVPAKLAMAFHYYCDEFNPLVKKTAVFFTLDVAECPQGPGKNSHAKVEKCLAEKWRGVPAESIGPLLARVVSVVLDLTEVF